MIRGRGTRFRALFVRIMPVVVLSIVAAGCGSTSPHLPHVTVSSVGGPRNYEWTITTASHGSGFGFSTLVVQYPNGHRRVWGGTALQDGVTGSAVFNLYKDMVPGDYRYFVYAMPVAPKTKWFEVPTRDWVAKNLIASGSFTIY